MIERKDITGMVLAGGRGSRMGGRDKGLISVAGRPMIEHVLEILQPQVGQLIINANRNLAQYAALGHAVISDSLEGFQGPLAGILAGLEEMQTNWLLTVPCDVPCLPADLGSRLVAAAEAEQARIAIVHDGKRLQPAMALISMNLGKDLRDYLEGGSRQLRQWCNSHAPALADFSDMPERFSNINDPRELRKLLDSGLIN